MISFFETKNHTFYAVGSGTQLLDDDKQKLSWLFGNALCLENLEIKGVFVGPRREMVTPWCTNAVEITQNMGIKGILRMEEFFSLGPNPPFDPMLQAVYNQLDQNIFTINRQPEPVQFIENIRKYSQDEGLALNDDEIYYLENLAKKLKRRLTDSEVFGFSQVNSEHCRHKIFNGVFVIDKKEMPETLFQLIKKTSKTNPNRIVSAYKDNCAFIAGPVIEQFAPKTQNKPDYFTVTDVETVISLKAETHNFPTTVEPFNGAATGTGGEIRDRMAGGKASVPLAGTAVYMSSYPRLGNNAPWTNANTERPWLYQSPLDILIKASNGASDFGNKFGQPLICGSVLSFENTCLPVKYGFDKVIMLAGGIGYARMQHSSKELPQAGDKVIVMGGDNYRIGMGGGAVSSVATGQFANNIELNAVQRSNPEMQKRVSNVVRAMAELDQNPIISIHDHGAGGHLNCLSELVESAGGVIDMSKLPVGDPTLSAKEIVGNESQERMGLVVHPDDVTILEEIARRERAPFYQVGQITGDYRFTFEEPGKEIKPIDLKLEDMFGNPPRTVLNDSSKTISYESIQYDISRFEWYLENVLQLESVACKDWLTNKVDRSVTGRSAMQQCAGLLHLPLNNCGVTALDYQGVRGIATSIGHAPVAALINPAAGSRLAIAEALTNIIWAPLKAGLSGISLSANWMWPCKNPGEDARLYKAVQAASDFAIALGINIPTGKDSLSMTQKYPDGTQILSPGTVIISAVAEVSDIRKSVSPVLIPEKDSFILYVPLNKLSFSLGGSSFTQTLNQLGSDTPDVLDSGYFARVFSLVQFLIHHQLILAGHDVSAGGMVVSLLEMCFSQPGYGMDINMDALQADNQIEILFSENPALILQVKDASSILPKFEEVGLKAFVLGKINMAGEINLRWNNWHQKLDIEKCRDTWFKTSYLLDQHQCSNNKALERFTHYKKHKLEYDFKNFTGKYSTYQIHPGRRQPSGIKAAIIREKGVNGDREMAYMLYLAGFDVKDVHMTDLIGGRETLDDIHMIVYVGGFSNSDVLGSAKGWAGAFIYNEKAKLTLDRFYSRPDTMSLGICNGCQLMIELGLVNVGHGQKPYMTHNESHKFESGFILVDILPNKSIMLQSLTGMKLGVWVAHGEGKFHFPLPENEYHIPVKYAYKTYPANPNGSAYNAAAICSADGRHLAMMPHLERAFFPWQWPYYPQNRKNDEVSPWIESLVNARKWIENSTAKK